MKNTKKIIILITIASISFLHASEIRFNKDISQKEVQAEPSNKEVVELKKKYSTPKLTKRTNTKSSRKNIRKEIILNSIKISYAKRVNQIEQCVLLSENLDDLRVCNQRVHNLSKNINKLTNRYNKAHKKHKKKFNKNY